MPEAAAGICRHMMLIAPLLLASALAAPGVVEGQVLGPAGPVGGVLIRALKPGVPWNISAGATAEQTRAFVREAPKQVVMLAQTRTAKNGAFRLAGLPPGPVVLWADGREKGQGLAEQVEVGAAPLTVTLGEAFLLDGDSLVRATENHPYPSQEPGLDVVAVHATLPLLLRGKTDDKGQFTMGHVPAGQYLVAGAGPGVLPVVTEVSVPAPKPEPKPAPKPVPKPEPRAAPDALGLDLAPTPTFPRPRLGRSDASYHQHGRVLLRFLSAVSLSGTITSRGAPVAGARVRLVQDGVHTTRATDARGRFSVADGFAFGTSIGLEATVGTRVARHCLLVVAEVGDTSCCSPSAGVSAEVVVTGKTLSCQVRVPMEPPPTPRTEASACPCDLSVLDAWAPDAGSAP